MRSVDVLVAGGGLAGLAVAVGLRFRGIDAHVFGKQTGLRKH
jgi:2-polyprenyl-6-methoxyphenol hydroxylase-like FAD-dependent oxidoreductase